MHVYKDLIVLGNKGLCSPEGHGFEANFARNKVIDFGHIGLKWSNGFCTLVLKLIIISITLKLTIIERDCFFNLLSTLEHKN